MNEMTSTGWNVAEQIIEDPVSGLTFQFEIVPGSSARYRLRVFGDIPFGNREIVFDEFGEYAGGGSFLRGHSKPTWLVPVEP
ncbi:MAG: hypothetical protein WEB58_14195 [Planctomycetaceae bacterium]